MKHTILIGTLFLFTILSACNLNKDRKLSAEEARALAKAHSDSVMLEFDSLYNTSIYVPPLYDKETFDSATTSSFFELAKATKGELKLLVNSKLISTEIIDIIHSYAEDNADIMILMDKTGSMSDDIENVQKGLNQVISTIEGFKNVRLSVALYGDKNADSTDWFSFKNFEKDYAATKQYINGITVSMGGDYPESVYEGFFKSTEQGFWKSSNKRMIILIGDAPPLEKPLSNYTINDVIKKATEDKITMNFYPIVVTPVLNFNDPSETAKVKTYEKDKIISMLYPNPSPGVINLSFDTNDFYTIEIYNSTGSPVLTDTYTGNQWRKDITTLANGVYVLRAIRKDKKFETIKFILHK